MDGAAAVTEKSIDIQSLALMMIHAYQTYDLRLIGSTIVAIEKSSHFPKIQYHVKSTPLPEGQENCKPTTEYKLVGHVVAGGTASLFQPENQPNVHTFFSPDLKLKNVDKENIYWQSRLMFGCNSLCVIMINVLKELRKLGYTHLTGQFQTDEGIIEEQINFENVSMQQINFTAKNNILIKKHYIPLSPNDPEIIKVTVGFVGNPAHVVLVCNNKYIIDMTGMQLGLRGRNGELVGRLELSEDYLKRFPHNIVEVKEPFSKSVESDLLDIQFKIHQLVIEPTIEEVVRNVREKKVWCSYCGTVAECLKKCGSCGKAVYCGRHCQKSDWAGHKGSCKTGDKK